MRRIVLAGAIALLVAGGSALAAETTAWDKPPEWIKKPGPEDLLSVWPPEAFKAGKSGKATIECRITTAGGLADCMVVSEEPAGAGFGAAALEVATQFLMKPAMKDGRAVEARGQFPIQFKAPVGGTSGAVDRFAAQGSAASLLPIEWLLAAPTAEEVRAVYPPKARAEGAGGRVNLVCAVQREGRLRQCDILNEEPKGLGLAAAARALTAKFTVRTEDPSGAKPKWPFIQIPMAFLPEMAADGPPPIGKPIWISLPTKESLQAALPPAASGQGRVILDCGVAAGGFLDDCKVESETPVGKGFGQGALKVAPLFKLSVWTNEGLPIVGGRVRIPLRFDLDPPPAP